MLAIDPTLPTPPFEQVKDQIVAQRASGELPAGHRLPPVRALAAELGVAPNTVARAYRELGREVVPLPRAGRVRDDLPERNPHVGRRRAARRVQEHVVRMEVAALGVVADDRVRGHRAGDHAVSRERGRSATCRRASRASGADRNRSAGRFCSRRWSQSSNPAGTGNCAANPAGGRDSWHTRRSLRFVTVTVPR